MDMKSDRALLAAVLSTMRYPLLLVGREGRIEAASHAAAERVNDNETAGVVN